MNDIGRIGSLAYFFHGRGELNEFIELEKGFIVRNLSGGRNMPDKGYFRVTVGTRQDMEKVAKIITDFTKA